MNATSILKFYVLDISGISVSQVQKVEVGIRKACVSKSDLPVGSVEDTDESFEGRYAKMEVKRLPSGETTVMYN